MRLSLRLILEFIHNRFYEKNIERVPGITAHNVVESFPLGEGCLRPSLHHFNHRRMIFRKPLPRCRVEDNGPTARAIIVEFFEGHKERKISGMPFLL